MLYRVNVSHIDNVYYIIFLTLSHNVVYFGQSHLTTLYNIQEELQQCSYISLNVGKL